MLAESFIFISIAKKTTRAIVASSLLFLVVFLCAFFDRADLSYLICMPIFIYLGITLKSILDDIRGNATRWL